MVAFSKHFLSICGETSFHTDSLYFLTELIMQAKKLILPLCALALSSFSLMAGGADRHGFAQ